MKVRYCNCRLPLAGGDVFMVEGGRFISPEAPCDRTVDLGGAATLPAFCDAHSHLLAYALSLTQADGARAATAQDFIALAEAFARENGLREEELVTIRNADRMPDPAALDACPRPLHLQTRSGHAGLFNAAARRLLGLGERAVLEETDYLAATRRIPMPPPAATNKAFSAAQAHYLSYGVTTAQEGILTREMFPLYARLAPALKLDVVAYTAPNDYDDACALFPRLAPAQPVRPEPALFIGGVKIFLDGSPQLKTAFLRAPYRGGGQGAQTMSYAEVVKACRFACERRAQLLAHCNGDGAAQLFLEALSSLTPEERRVIRPVLIHGQILGDDQLDRIGALKIVPSFFPAHIRAYGETHLNNLGEPRGMRISPARSALLRGIPFTLHQDAPVFAPDPLEAVHNSVLRRTEAGRRLCGQEIGVCDALRAVTEHAAAQYGFRDRGRIVPGYRADFVLLDRDPRTCPPEELNELHVIGTYRCGTRVFSATEKRPARSRADRLS